MDYQPHKSVLLKECLHFLTENTQDLAAVRFADMTFGAGGHSLSLAQLSPRHRVWSVDQDPEALIHGRSLIEQKGLQAQVQLLHMNFSQFPQWVREQGGSESISEGFHGILLDLGVSSHHFDSFERGFSFRENAPLDMRMNPQDHSLMTAAELIRDLSEEELSNLFFRYGEERWSRRIARKIAQVRQERPLDHTLPLAELIASCVPRKGDRQKIHPATRCFQALRLFVNQELEVLTEVLEPLFDLLAPGGRLLVISFHSLEDRIVKNEFKRIFLKNKEHSRILTKRPLVAGEEELRENPRARSAKLRVIEKTSPLET